MRNHDDRPTFFVKLPQKRQDLIPGIGIKVSRRFIGQDDRRVVREHPGQRHALLLADTQLTRFMLQTILQADGGQQFLGPLLSLRFILLRQHHGDLHILYRRQIRDQVECLKHKPELILTDFGPLFDGEVVDRFPVQQNPSLGRSGHRSQH